MHVGENRKKDLKAMREDKIAEPKSKMDENFSENPEMDVHLMPMQDGAELKEFLIDTFPLTDKEAKVLLEYMDGHGYALAGMMGELYRGDLCKEVECIIWEKYSIDDAINAAFEWNEEMLQDSKEDMERAENFHVYKMENSRLVDLQEDEKILDSLFDRSKYGERLNQLAEILVIELLKQIDDIGIDNAVKSLAGRIASDKEQDLRTVSETVEIVGRGR